MRRIHFLFLLAGLALVSCRDESSGTMSDSIAETDPYLWLEEVEGDEALAWVRAQNERTLNELESDPVFPAFEAAALDVLTSKERIPYGNIRDGLVYNFWQDEIHVRGLWRRVPLESYRMENPAWETILDFDELAREEGKNWVFKGADVFRVKGQDRYYCLISLSDGGKDAVVKREFDLRSLSFVEDGFVTPEAKQGSAWAGPDVLLIGTDWGEGSLTESGYPRIVKRWRRGTPLDEAEEILEGDRGDVGIWPYTLEMVDGKVLQCVEESDTFFTSTHWWLPEGESEPVQIPIPPKSSIAALDGSWLLISLKQDWECGDLVHRSGDLVAFDLESFLRTRELPPVELVFHPDEKQAVKGVSVSKGAALLSINDRVTGRVLRLKREEKGWQTSPVELPANGEAGVAFADDEETTAFLTFDGFLTPDSLFEYDSGLGAVTLIKSLSPKFDTTGLVVDQFFARSVDGTEIPYFAVHREDIPLDGSTPTLLYGYGGFQISLTPGYNGTTGRLWLEKGGAYILANIRGGGEFGPTWHQAGLKGNRQRVYDDFVAVAEDVIAKGISSPPHLGIMGGSNGGLLMGVMLNQRPDLWNAVVVQVPLLDMLRYHLLLAGASWVDEYGSPEVPEERAFLETISPYHNFDPEKKYPVPFFVTSTKDDRVHPGHARKMAKKFEDAGLPFLYYENIDGGHSAAANQAERARRTALEYTYLTRRLLSE